MSSRPRAVLASLVFAGAACSSTPPPAPQPPPPPVMAPVDAGAPVAEGPRPRVQPPASGPARDVHLPPVRRSRLPNGLEVNTVEYHTLPVLHIRLTVRAGQDTDPANLPGLASITGDMLKEGTRTKTSAQIAETIEFVGGTLDVTTTPDYTTVSIAVLKDHADTALTLLGEVLTEPTFPQSELDKLRRRENDRLQRSENDPGWLTRRAFLEAVYGANHPYARFDTTRDALRRITRADLVSYHHQRYVAGNMFLVAVGDIVPADFDALVARTLGRVRAGTAPAVTFPPLPDVTARQVILVDRPNSPQSVVRIGNPALRRRDEEFVPFTVANHVLGGGAASRLFMDLRELRSLTYGAYARVGESVDVGSWFAGAQVRTPMTGDALHAFYRHLECITHDPPPDAEMAQTRSYLIDSFPLSIETPGNVADLVSSLRIYNLPDDYYDTFRTRVGQVDGAAALATAQRYIHPDKASLVVVGSASAPVEVGPLCAALAMPDHAHNTLAQQIAVCATRDEAHPRATQTLQEVLQTFGPVRVVDLQGHLVRELPATVATEGPVRAQCSEISAPALQALSHAEPGRQAAPPH